MVGFLANALKPLCGPKTATTFMGKTLDEWSATRKLLPMNLPPLRQPDVERRLPTQTAEVNVHATLPNPL